MSSLFTAKLDLVLTWLLTSGIRLVFLLVVAYLLLRAVRLLTDKFNHMLLGFTHSVERQKRAQTLSYIARAVATTVLSILTAMLLLEEVGINITPLLTAAGIGGLAIGFGAQNLVRDVISGFFLLLEDQVRIGDLARINGVAGTVEQINLRTIVLRDVEGAVQVFPNGTITALANLSKQFAYAVVDMRVSYGVDLDRVIGAAREVGAVL